MGNLLLDGLNALRLAGIFCDVTLRVGERSFRVHKNVISSVSLFFKSICLESDQEEISLDEVDGDIMELLVDCVYTGNLKVGLSNVKEILLTNSRLQILYADKLCYGFILHKLKVETFGEYWNFSKNNSIEYLKDLLIKKAVDIFPNLFSERESLKIEFEFEEIKQLLEMLHERGYAEDLILSFLMRWISHSNETRGKYTKDLLDLLQPSLISPNLFHRLEMVNASNPYFTAWAKRKHPPYSINVTCEHVFIFSYFFRVTFWRLGLFSQAEDTEIDFPQRLTDWGSFVCNGYYIYHQGGSRDYSNPIVMTESYVYHPTTHVWTPFVPLLEARSYHGSCILNQKIFSVGGRDRLGRTQSSVEFTDLCTGQKAFVTSMPHTKELFGLGVHENSIYVVGGYSDEGSFCVDNYRFDEREGVWQSLRSSPSTFTEFSNSCAIACESMYVSDDNTLHRYDIRTNKWESIVTRGGSSKSGDVFSVGNTLYRLFKGCIGRYIPEERSWVNQRSWEVDEEVYVSCCKVSANLLNPVI